MRQIEYLQPRLFRVDIGSYGTSLYKLSDGVFDLICTQFLLSSFNWQWNMLSKLVLIQLFSCSTSITGKTLVRSLTAYRALSQDMGGRGGITCTCILSSTLLLYFTRLYYWYIHLIVVTLVHECFLFSHLHSFVNLICRKNGGIVMVHVSTTCWEANKHVQSLSTIWKYDMPINEMHNSHMVHRFFKQHIFFVLSIVVMVELKILIWVFIKVLIEVCYNSSNGICCNSTGARFSKRRTTRCKLKPD